MVRVDIVSILEDSCDRFAGLSSGSGGDHGFFRRVGLSCKYQKIESPISQSVAIMTSVDLTTA